MKLRLSANILQPLLILFGLLAVYFFLNISGSLMPGSNWSTINTNLIKIWPLIMVLAFALFVYTKVVKR